MKVKIVVPAYASTDYLRKLINSAYSGNAEVEVVIFTHSSRQDMLDVIDEEIIAGKPIKVFDYQENRGIARTWNDGMLYAFDNGADVLIIANDDVYFFPGDVDRIAKKAIENRDNYMVSVAGYHEGLSINRPSHGYSCYALNPIALDKIGCFDENLWPAYFEDVDHHRRATMLGLVEENCSNTNVIHGGSKTIEVDQVLSVQNMSTQRDNAIYIRQKWDSDSHEGGYDHPFNDDQFGLKIEVKDRHAPYPGYNRKHGGNNG